jgi:hypothetical protein
MIRMKLIEEQLRQGRIDAKTLDSMFCRRIEEGANCSPFVSQAILTTVKEVFPIGLDDPGQQLGLGQIKRFSKRRNSCHGIGPLRRRRDSHRFHVFRAAARNAWRRGKFPVIP